MLIMLLISIYHVTSFQDKISSKRLNSHIRTTEMFLSRLVHQNACDKYTVAQTVTNH